MPLHVSSRRRPCLWPQSRAIRTYLQTVDGRRLCASNGESSAAHDARQVAAASRSVVDSVLREWRLCLRPFGDRPPRLPTPGCCPFRSRRGCLAESLEAIVCVTLLATVRFASVSSLQYRRETNESCNAGRTRRCAAYGTVESSREAHPLSSALPRRDDSLSR